MNIVIKLLGTTALTVALILTVRSHIINSVLQIFLVVIFHEMCHVITATLLRVRISKVSLYPIGIRINFDTDKFSIVKGVCVCLSGSIIGLTAATILYFSPLEQFDGFIFTSISLNTVNLLPIKKLDGGELLSMLVNDIFMPDTAEKITKFTSTSCILIFWILSVTFQMKFSVNIAMMIFTVYLIYSLL